MVFVIAKIQQGNDESMLMLKGVGERCDFCNISQWVVEQYERERT
jgi:hypothetical protein